MSYVGVTTKEYESQLAALGMSLIKPENLDEIPKVSQVFIYDYSGMFSQAYLRAVITNGNSLVYCFHDNGESNTQFLSEVGVYNCYADVEPTDITAGYVQEKFATKNTLQDVQGILRKNKTITTFNLNLYNLDSFLKAIDRKDTESVITIFNESFDKFVDIKSQIDVELTKIETLKRDVLVSENNRNEAVEKLEALTTEYQQTLKDGRMVEENNRKLSDGIKKLDSILQERDKALSTANDRANNLQIELNRRDTKITELSNKLVEVSNTCNTLKFNNENLNKQLHTMSTSITQNFTADNIKLQLTNTGSVNKILYIKVIDQVPYLVKSLENFPTYIANIKKVANGCTMVLIAPQDSTIFAQYSKTNRIISDTTVYENCAGNMFVMDGFSTAIERFIRDCGCDMCVILDMSFKMTPLTESLKQKNVYVINSDDTIERYTLNPRECISYNTELDTQVAGFIPTLTREELDTAYKAQKKLRDSLYSVLDSLWGGGIL